MRAGPSRSEISHFTSVTQLGAAGIEALLEEAAWIRVNGAPMRRSFSAALLMLQPSLRTRLGFATAVQRLGGAAHVVSSRRDIAESSVTESLADTLRVVSGLSDLTVVRTDGDLARHLDHCVSPVINAGDDVEHPTQALIDLFAITQLRGPIGDLSICICGDLTMRASRSLLMALALLPPQSLTLIAPPSRRGDAHDLVAGMASSVRWGVAGDWSEFDVLYLAGLPERRRGDWLPTDARAPYALTGRTIETLAPDACVLSPMPVIDEITDTVRGDPRIAIYAQSDLGVAMRMAVLARGLGTAI